MTIAELLDAAKRKQGSLGAIAQRFGFHQSCLSAWRAGKRKPDAGDIMLLAEMAGLPAFETLAQIEQELDAKNASVWARALGNLRAAGVAATVILGLVIYSMTPKTASAAVTNFVTPSPASAAPHQESRAKSVHVMSNYKEETSPIAVTPARCNLAGQRWRAAGHVVRIHLAKTAHGLVCLTG